MDEQLTKESFILLCSPFDKHGLKKIIIFYAKKKSTTLRFRETRTFQEFYDLPNFRYSKKKLNLPSYFFK